MRVYNIMYVFINDIPDDAKKLFTVVLYTNNNPTLQ